MKEKNKYLTGLFYPNSQFTEHVYVYLLIASYLTI